MRDPAFIAGTLAIILCTAFAFASQPASPVIEPRLAAQYFHEAHAICEQDRGSLWGQSLCGPMLFADPHTHAVVANQADAEGKLKAEDGVFVGTLPSSINIANTALEWSGTRWTMVMWPLPPAPTVRARLMMHELFHRIQTNLRLPASNPGNAHLGTLEGRLWLELEWRALGQALARPYASTTQRKQAIADALALRAHRHALFPGAAEEERLLVLNEGLAEYTGYKLRGTSDEATAEAVIQRLSSSESDTALSRSFAYVSGPAYGLLLDLSRIPWRRGLNANSDLGAVLGELYRVTVSPDSLAVAGRAAARYDGNALRWSEMRRAEEREQVVREYKRRLVDGPVLILPAKSKFNFGFDPNDVVPIDGQTSAYGSLRVTDEWGILEATNGALIVRADGKFDRVIVEAPKPREGVADKISGNGWTLILAPGWRLSPSSRVGDFVVTMQ